MSYFIHSTIMELLLSWTKFTILYGCLPFHHHHHHPRPGPRELTTKPIVKPSSWSSGIRIANIQYKSQACQGPYCARVVLHTD